MELRGWRLRATRGVTQRANSVWTSSGGRVVALENQIATMEDFYRDRGLPPLVQLTDSSQPEGLDETLAQRGYQARSPVSIQTASACKVVERTSTDSADSLVRAVVYETMPDPWFDISGRRGRFEQVQDIYRGLLKRIPGRTGYALAEVGGQPAGVGLLVSDGPWAGVFSMLTLRAFRRRGCGRALLHAMARAADSWGARRLYLQLERDNESAAALYHRAGFREAYGYHYRLGSLHEP